MELSAGISSEVMLIVQSVIIFFMAAEGGISEMARNRAAARRVRRAARKAQKEGCRMSDIFNILLVQNTLRTATPVVLCALGCLMTDQVGIMNIGVDGMMLMGAFFRRAGQLPVWQLAYGHCVCRGAGRSAGAFLLCILY